MNSQLFNANLRFISLGGMCSFLSFCSAATVPPPVETIDQPENVTDDKMKQPNIVLIVSDEQNANMIGCMGDPYIHTPNLDALAANGILMDNHYCASPISGPSRQTLTMGKYVSSHNVWGNNRQVCPNNTVSLPRLMQAVGYDVVLSGGMKYQGMNYGFNTYNKEKGAIIPARNREKAPELCVPQARKSRLSNGVGVFRDNGDELDKEFTKMGATDMSDYVDVARLDNALAFIQSRKEAKSDKPFFLLVGFMAPHYPLQSTPELIAKYKGRVPMPEIPDGYLETLPLNYKHLRNERKFENVPDDVVRTAREAYYAKVEWGDQQVGKLIDAIRNSELSDNTIIIYTSDHGENLGEHGLWWKNCLYDPAAKVPLIFNFPKRWKGGQKRTEASCSVDLVQTIADWGGAKVPSDWDGYSLAGWLDNPEKNPSKNRAVCEYYSGYIASGITMYRKGEWKYVYHTRANEQYGPVIELYNMKNDPKEFKNLAGDPKYASLIKTLHAELVKETGEDPEQTERRYRAGAIPESHWGVLKP